MLLGARFSPRSAARRTACAIAVVACLAGSGCGEDRLELDTPSTKPRGLAPRSETTSDNGASTNAAVVRTTATDDAYSNLKLTAPAAEAAEAAQKEQPRDYAAELVGAMSGTESCVQPRPASASLPPELMLSLEAMVLESGTVISGTARASLLTPEELECVKRRLESTRLADHVKDAPLRVSGTLKLTFRQAPPAQNAAIPAPQAAAAPPPEAAAAAPSEQTPPEDTSGTVDEPEAIAPVEPSAAPSEY